MTIDRTPAIIACMRDLADTALATRADDDSPDLNERYIAARAIASACDDVAAARLYPWTGVDEMQALGLWRFLRGNDPAPATADDRAVACRVAARFSEVALALATQATGAEEAAWLWSAAGRLSDLVDLDGLQVAGLRAEVDALRYERDAALSELVDRADADRAKASWEATQGAHALAMVGAAVGLSNLPKDPLDAAKAITDRLATSQRPVANGPQVGDIIAAADVPRRTLVECPNKALVIRMPTGKGWSLDAAGGPAHSGWPWDGGMTDTPKVRILALDIPAEKCFAVAGMTPAEAREWLAQRVASEPVR